MNHFADKLSSWTPEAFEWLKNISITEITSSPTEKAHYLVLVNSSAKEGISLDANGLEKDCQDELLRQIHERGLKELSETLILSYKDSFYCLLKKPSLATSSEQKGRELGALAAKKLGSYPIEKLVISAGKEISALSLFLGWSSGLYQLKNFKENKKSLEKENKQNFAKQVFLLSKHKSQEKEIDYTRALAEAQQLTRTLEDAPANWLTSEKFADLAEEVFQPLEAKCSIMGKKELTRLGMGAFLSVAQGTKKDPKLITLEISAKNKKTSETLVLIGKGLTFDAGGVSLKPAASMAEMKYDMCGGAAVFGAAYLLAKVKTDVNVVCLIGAVENLISYEATRPGDIVQSMSGKTIEVLNTDAEGRLVLADLIHHAKTKWKPALMIDVATLTGAVLMALGSCGAALMTNKQEIADYLLKTAKETGEPLWQLPLWPELAKELKSEIADLKNITSPKVRAGSLTAACFLQEFAGESPWAHLDIAGTGWDCQASGYPLTGGSAYGVHLLAQACLNWQS